MKRLYSLFCAAAVTVSALTGCGSEASQSLSSDSAPVQTVKTITGQIQAIEGENVTLLLGEVTQLPTESTVPEKTPAAEGATQETPPSQTFVADKETQTLRILSYLAIEKPDGTDGVLADLAVGNVLSITLVNGEVQTVLLVA